MDFRHVLGLHHFDLGPASLGSEHTLVFSYPVPEAFQILFRWFRGWVSEFDPLNYMLLAGDLRTDEIAVFFSGNVWLAQS